MLRQLFPTSFHQVFLWVLANKAVAFLTALILGKSRAFSALRRWFPYWIKGLVAPVDQRSDRNCDRNYSFSRNYSFDLDSHCHNCSFDHNCNFDRSFGHSCNRSCHLNLGLNCHSCCPIHCTSWLWVRWILDHHHWDTFNCFPNYSSWT